ncbi:MAG: methyltransferase domain-containing protein [Patescibacteria group bacterium]
MSSFPYDQADYEEVPCNFCGNNRDFKIIAIRDKDNLPTRTCLCRRCGLIFINPRMTKDWYNRYYDEEYRERDRMKKKPAGNNLERQFGAGEHFGESLVKLISPYLKPGVIIDVGSGVGGGLSGFKKYRPDLQLIGIEPSAKESAYANVRGIKTHNTLFESFTNSILSPANIMNTRALNHLLDPQGFIKRAHDYLMPDGRLILAVQNFRLSSKKIGRIVPQIDHVYMFTPEILLPMIESVGFEIVFFSDPEKMTIHEQRELKSLGLTNHLKLVAKKINRPNNFNPISIQRSVKISKSLNPIRIKSFYWRHRFASLLLKRVSHKFLI